jgi:putative transposase
MQNAPLVPKDHAEQVALFRSEIIGALTRRELDRGELVAAFRGLSAERFRPPGCDHTRRYSVTSLERWYYAYRAGGLEALRPLPRSDRGRARHLTNEQRELLLDIRREHPSASVPLILRTLIADGRLDREAVSETTVRRLYAEKGLDRIGLRDGAGAKTRLRWQAERPGALWHGDVCYGPSLVIDGETHPVRIHALLDDASRYIVAIEAHHTEREVDMLGLWVRALRRYGAPEALYLDNGSTYRGEVLRLACERVGITLLHAKPYDAPARGKMERFWRTLREGCLDFVGSLSSLHDLNMRLLAFVDTHYHQAPHASLMGRSPGIVFGEAEAQMARDGHLTEDQLRRALTVEERRRVTRDTTVSVDGQVWELDQGFLAGRIVTIGRSLLCADEEPWVEHEGKRLPLHLVNPEKNARRARPLRHPVPTPPVAPVHFDPPGALLDRMLGRTPKKSDSSPEGDL